MAIDRNNKKGGRKMKPVSKEPKRELSGKAYLEFLRQYLELFKPQKKREKITGIFIF